MRGDTVVRGAEIRRTLGLTPKQLVDSLVDLSAKNLVSVTGELTDDRIDLAVLSVHPSNRSFVRAL